MLHGANREGFLSLWQVQPQALCLRVITANDDDVGHCSSAYIALYTRRYGEVVWDDYMEENYKKKLLKM